MTMQLTRAIRQQLRRALVYLQRTHPTPWRMAQFRGHGAENYIVDASYPEGYTSVLAQVLLSFPEQELLVTMPDVLEALLDEVERLQGEPHYTGLCPTHDHPLDIETAECFHCTRAPTMNERLERVLHAREADDEP